MEDPDTSVRRLLNPGNFSIEGKSLNAILSEEIEIMTAEAPVAGAIAEAHEMRQLVNPEMPIILLMQPQHGNETIINEDHHINEVL